MKLKMVDPVRSLLTKLQMRHQPYNPYFWNPIKKGEVRNPHVIGGILPGETRNPEGCFGTRRETVKMLKGRYLAVVRMQKYNRGGRIRKMKNPKKPGRSPEGLKLALDARAIQEMARKHAPDAIKAMAEIIKSKVASDLAKISASNALLDRGYGKALQTNVNATVNTDGSAKEIDGEELDRRVKEVLGRVERITKRKREKIKSEDQPADIRQLH